jgi:PIN domain nuclease of toxin-antitoxin system
VGAAGLKVLLDTHALLWWLADHPSLSRRAWSVISLTRNQVIVSAASVWEIAIKANAGKLVVPDTLLTDFIGVLAREGFDPLSITPEHAIRAGNLPGPHHDHFDRMLIAQAQIESLAIIGKDAFFDKYGVNRVW